MNEQIASLLGWANSESSWGAYILRANDSNLQPSVATPQDIQIANETINRINQPKLEGNASVTSPVESPKSVGGSSARTSSISGSGVQKDGSYIFNGKKYDNEDSFLKSKENPNNSGEWFDNKNASTAFQVQHFLSGTAEGMKAIASIGNGYVMAGQYTMKANQSEYLARQNQRNADSMVSNIREINRAAQSDVNVMSEQATKRKSEQRIAQGASGFKVGAGSYKVLSENTDFKTNYNASMVMLKAGLQGAEVLRQAGALEAQSIINKADAEIARGNAKTSKTNALISGISGAVSSGTQFYIGRDGSE
jgi:hypothetical protein